MQRNVIFGPSSLRTRICFKGSRSLLNGQEVVMAAERVVHQVVKNLAKIEVTIIKSYIRVLEQLRDWHCVQLY
jgi:hypothetical protein